MTRAGRLTAALAALLLFCGHAAGQSSASTPLTVSAVVLSKNTCRFQNASLSPSTLSFTLDPNAAVDTTSNTLTWQFKCTGSDLTVSYSITADNGANPAGGRRQMRQGTTSNYIPYGLTISPSSGTANKNDIVSFTLQASVLAGDYLNAMAGSYTDAVTVSIQP